MLLSEEPKLFVKGNERGCDGVRGDQEVDLDGMNNKGNKGIGVGELQATNAS